MKVNKNNDGHRERGAVKDLREGIEWRIAYKETRLDGREWERREVVAGEGEEKCWMEVEELRGTAWGWEGKIREKEWMDGREGGRWRDKDWAGERGMMQGRRGDGEKRLKKPE